jgi:hypothetical protein
LVFPLSKHPCDRRACELSASFAIEAYELLDVHWSALVLKHHVDAPIAEVLAFGSPFFHG